MTPARPASPDIEAFVVELIADYRWHNCMDIDGGDFHELCIKHGLMVERPATAEDLADEDWAHEFGVEEGDTIVTDSPWLTEVKARRG